MSVSIQAGEESTPELSPEEARRLYALLAPHRDGAGAALSSLVSRLEAYVYRTVTIEDLERLLAWGRAAWGPGRQERPDSPGNR